MGGINQPLSFPEAFEDSPGVERMAERLCGRAGHTTQPYGGPGEREKKSFPFHACLPRNRFSGGASCNRQHHAGCSSPFF